MIQQVAKHKGDILESIFSLTIIEAIPTYALWLCDFKFDWVGFGMFYAAEIIVILVLWLDFLLDENYKEKETEH